MNTLGIGSTKSERKTPAPRPQSTEQPAKKSPGVPLSPFEDLHILIAKRAYDLYGELGYRHGSALDDWLEAEREILSEIPSV